MERINGFKDGVITVFADTSLYSKDSIFKCLYWYGDKFHTSVTVVDSQTYQITIKPLSNFKLEEDEYELYLQKLERDLIDFNLRDIVSKETKSIRELLVAKAFSNGEFDEEPIGTLSDPVGFDVNQI